MIPTRLSDYLDARGARYEIFQHPHSRTSVETARSAHVPPHQLAKSVLLEDDEGCVLAVVPADRVVRLHEVARLLGRRDLHLSDEERIAALFEDCDRGAVPALGMAWGLETVVDHELEANDSVYIEAGDHCSLLRLPRDQFQALMRGARHGRICKPLMH